MPNQNDYAAKRRNDLPEIANDLASVTVSLRTNIRHRERHIDRLAENIARERMELERDKVALGHHEHALTEYGVRVTEDGRIENL